MRRSGCRLKSQCLLGHVPMVRGRMRATGRWAAPPETRQSHRPAALTSPASVQERHNECWYWPHNVFLSVLHESRQRCANLFKERQVAAALSETQQQGQDVDSGGWLRWAGHSRSRLGQTKLLGYWSKRRDKLQEQKKQTGNNNNMQSHLYQTDLKLKRFPYPHHFLHVSSGSSAV